jgi:hypothetical protein
MTDPKKPREIDLHPAEWKPDWQQPIGNDPLPGEKPHIWQEYKRDRHLKPIPGTPVFGRGWPILVVVLFSIAVASLFEMQGGPEWLLAVRNLF